MLAMAREVSCDTHPPPEMRAARGRPEPARARPAAWYLVRWLEGRAGQALGAPRKSLSRLR